MFRQYRSPKINIYVTSIDGEKYEFVSEELQGDLLSLSTNKDINDIAGTFSMTLIARNNLQNILNLFQLTKRTGKVNAYDIFKPKTLVDIYINDKEVMLGTVDYVEKNTDIAGGRPSRTFTISGRDLGSFFIDNSIWYDKNPEAIARENFVLTKGYNYLKNSIKNLKNNKIIETVFDTWLVTALNNPFALFKFSDYELINQKITCKTGIGIGQVSYASELLLDFNAWNFEGNIFQFLKSFSSPPFNELFIDTGDRNITLNQQFTVPDFETGVVNGGNYLDKKKVHVIFRPSPFGDKDIKFYENNLLYIQDLETNYINDENIKNKKLKFSADDVYTFYSVIPLSKFISDDQGGYFITPEYDFKKLSRYGHRPLEVRIDSLSSSKASKSTFKAISSEYQKLLKYWFSNNDSYLKGSFNIQGDENIRIGQRLVYGKDQLNQNIPIEDDYERGHYYITGVSHDYTFGNSFRTTLSVGRGTTDKLKNEMKLNLADL